MSEYLREQAEKIGNDKTLLVKRLKEAKSVLIDELRFKFSIFTIDKNTKRMYCQDKSMYLQWKNEGETNCGSVSIHINKNDQ